MDTFGFKRFFRKVQMPDKDDPGYKETYDLFFSAGEVFAKITGLAWLGKKYITYGASHTKELATVMMGILFAGALIFFGKITRNMAMFSDTGQQSVAVKRQEALMKNKNLIRTEQINNNNHETGKKD